MTRAEKIRRELKALRQDCICQHRDPLLREIAYAIEQAVRYATEDGIRGWESLSDQARVVAVRLAKDVGILPDGTVRQPLRADALAPPEP